MNRVLRLAPLLVVVFAMYLATGQSDWKAIAYGFVFPTWPGVAWSVAPEIHFYLLFPILLVAIRKHGVFSLLLVMLAAITFRFALWTLRGEVQSVAYWTIVGRIDQFLWGMLLGVLVNDGYFNALPKRVFALIAFATLIGFLAFWHYFNSVGGFYFLPSYPSPSLLWVYIPAIEGAAYAIFIAWYSEADFCIPKQLDRILASIGAVSFSIYLWHWPLRLPIRDMLQRFGFEMGDFVGASISALIFFGCVTVLSFASYRLIERPFLAFRVNYLRKAPRSRSQLTDQST